MDVPLFLFDKEDTIFLISDFISKGGHHKRRGKQTRRGHLPTFVYRLASVARSYFVYFFLYLLKAHYQVDLRNQTSAQQERGEDKPTSIVHHRTSVGAVSMYSGSLFVRWLLVQLIAVDERPEAENSLARPERILVAQRGQGRRGQVSISVNPKKKKKAHCATFYLQHGVHSATTITTK